jgi:microcystin degradation protein MlrC
MLLASIASPQGRPRVAVASIMHESNSFNPAKTGLADFERRPVTPVADALREWDRNQDEVGGYVEGSRKFGLDLYPILVAGAVPKGPVTDEALDALTGEIIRGLKTAPKLDGLLLALHGAMVTEKHPHADAEVLRRLREALGPSFPIVVTHDFHANVSEEAVKLSTALVTYKLVPHLDRRDRGLKAAEIMAGILSGKLKPVQRIAKPAMIYNILYHNTSVEPLAPIVEETRRLEKQPGILAASVAGGYQYADVPAVGPSAIVVTNNDPALAEREAKRLSDMLWATRDRLKLNLPESAQAVKLAMASDRFPVVLVEMGDNIGGGSAGDATFILSELVKQKARGWVVVVADPPMVQQAIRTGVGKRFEGLVGGKTDKLHGEPVMIRGTVKSLHDGKYMETEVRHSGRRYLDQGLTAVIEVEGSSREEPNLLMLTTERETPFSLHQLIAHGVYPERQKILVVKAAIAYRAAYEPVAKRIIEVDTPGTTAVNPARFKYQKARRPLFGLE